MGGPSGLLGTAVRYISKTPVYFSRTVNVREYNR